MNKRELIRYLKKGEKYNPILGKCFKYEDGFVISDKYSIIYLNDNHGIDVVDDVLGIGKFCYNFDNNYEFDFKLEELEIVSDKDQRVKVAKLRDNFEINVSLLNRIKHIIKSNDISIIINMDNSNTIPIIKLTNTKTNERGYLLPMRKF